MKNLFKESKKVLLSSLFMFLITSNAGAQSPENLAPSLYIHDVVFDKPFYYSDETITGSFLITNDNKSSFADNVSFKTEVVGGFDEGGFPTVTFLSSDNWGDYTIAGGSRQSINFSYKLPKSLPAKDVGIELQAFIKDDSVSGRGSSKFDYRGNVEDYKIETLSLVVVGENNDIFYPLEGPIVKKGEFIDIVSDIFNKTDSEISITPFLTVYKKLTSGEVLRNSNEEKIVLLANETKTHKIALPTFNDKPGSYTAVIDYKDSSGENLVPSIEFRYLVGPLNPEIDSLTISHVDMTQVEKFTVNLRYADSPLDIRFDADGDSVDERFSGNNFDLPKRMMANVLLINTATQKIISKEEVVFEDSSNAEIVFDSFEGVSNLTVKAELIRDGVVLDTQESNFDVITDPKKFVFLEMLFGSMWFWIILSLILVTGSIFGKKFLPKAI